MAYDIDRRDFLERSAATAAAALTAGFTATAGGYAANETLNVGCIGTGGRCRHLLKSLRELPGVRIAALCDVYDEALKLAQPLAAPNAATFKDYRRLLDRKDIDAVLIASPDHWHVPLTIAAVEAGKDVYVEKPLTHNLDEGASILAAHKRFGKIVQVGMQQRSMPHIEEARRLVQAGKLGQVFKADVSWNRNVDRGSGNRKVDPAAVDWKMFLGNARPQAFDPYRMQEWRWFWDFGGGLFTDLMVHFLDVAHWCCDLTQPKLAVSVGEHIHARGLWETPDTVQTLLQYPAKSATQPTFQVHYEGTFSNAFRGAMLVLMGSQGTLYIDRGRYEFLPERNKTGALQKILSTKPTNKGADFYDLPDGEKLHLANWLECIRTKKQPTAPIEAGVNAAAAAHLANHALRFGGLATMPNVG